jgi:hypothetical protein
MSEHTKYIITTNSDHILNTIWYYTQYQGLEIPMYKARISRSSTSWVVEVPDTKQGTWMLLNYGNYLEPIKTLYYV